MNGIYFSYCSDVLNLNYELKIYKLPIDIAVYFTYNFKKEPISDAAAVIFRLNENEGYKLAAIGLKAVKRRVNIESD